MLFLVFFQYRISDFSYLSSTFSNGGLGWVDMFFIVLNFLFLKEIMWFLSYFIFVFSVRMIDVFMFSFYCIQNPLHLVDSLFRLYFIVQFDINLCREFSHTIVVTGFLFMVRGYMKIVNHSFCRVIPSRCSQPVAYRLYMELLKRHIFTLKSQINGPNYQM